ncbi:membrane-associated proteins in eicosanoid and glutathione metabolism [Vararia minispora EC-137]|uniref:Membrane-associated proteins in eicosanoid and glutathione metabolism n=1 Tax=Vararia minispora EC-137 TaxID=1314806 RepID=A0ACB8QTY3_9AGAM|nr:membrane-associated proteins in eicosanoid and glutathione metabolism [Vararia minispora EC-137]
MSSTIVVPPRFSWVIASLSTIPVLLTYQLVKTARARSRAKIPYPQLYAEKAEQEASLDAKIFNCTQRAHQNTLESVPVVLITTLISGLRYPTLAAGACGIFVLTRWRYTVNYSTGVPDKRAFPARIGYATMLSLLGMSLKAAYDLVRMDM